MQLENTSYSKVVYLIRHAESEGNYLYEQSGHTKLPEIFDPDLTEKGQKQAIELGEQLRNINCDLIITSPLTRSINTMRISIKTEECNYIISHLCREVKQEQSDFFPNEEIIFESEAEVMTRCGNFRNFLRSFNEEIKTIFVFTHSDFIWNLTAIRKDDGELYGKWLKNGEWTEIYL